MEFRECLARESRCGKKEAYGFFVEILNRYQHRIRKVEDIVIKEIYTDKDMPILVRDYFLSAKNAFDIISLMKERAYSRETEKYAKEREEELKDISFRITKEINEMLGKRETRSISKNKG